MKDCGDTEIKSPGLQEGVDHNSQDALQLKELKQAARLNRNKLSVLFGRTDP